MFRWVKILFLILICCSCSKNTREINQNAGPDTSGGTVGDTDPFLSSTDRRAPTQLAAISAKNFEAALNQQGYGYLTRPDDDDDSDCNDKLFSKMIASVSGKVLIIANETETDSCETGKGTGSSSLNDVKFRVLLYVKCDDDSLDQYQGKSLKELQNFHRLCESGTFLLNQKIEGNIDISQNGLEVTTKVELVDGMMNSASRPCEATRVESGAAWKNCYKFSKQEYSNTKATGTGAEGVDTSTLFPNSIFEIKHSNSVYGSPNDKFFLSGNATFRLNAWRGDFDYSGANKAPKWNASLSGETLKGEFKGR